MWETAQNIGSTQQKHIFICNQNIPKPKPHWLMLCNVSQSDTKHPKTSHFQKLAPFSKKIHTSMANPTGFNLLKPRNTEEHGVKPRCSNFDKGLWWDSAHFPEIFHPFLRSMWKWKVQHFPKQSMDTPGSLKTKLCPLVGNPSYWIIHSSRLATLFGPTGLPGYGIYLPRFGYPPGN